MDTKKFYWLKLQSDFFKRHDIKIIEAMPNGKDYVLFYLKLLCESITHEGRLRFSEVIPYNEEMLATITSTNVDVVKTAIQIFTQLNLMEIMDDGTYYFNEVKKMIGSAIDNPDANRMRRLRAKKNENKLLANMSTNANRTKSSQEIDIELDIDKELDIDNKRHQKENDDIKNDTNFTSDLDFLSGVPTLQEVKDFVVLKSYSFDPEDFYNYYSAIGWKKNGQPIENWQAVATQWGRKNNMQNGMKDIAQKEQQAKPQYRPQQNVVPNFEMRKYTQQEMDDIFNSISANNISDDDI